MPKCPFGSTYILIVHIYNIHKHAHTNVLTWFHIMVAIFVSFAQFAVQIAIGLGAGVVTVNLYTNGETERERGRGRQEEDK